MVSKNKTNILYRPNYHFCIPSFGFPGDPNGMFFSNGLFHMMFIYDQDKESYAYGHATSSSLLDWKLVNDSLVPDNIDGGIYSGGTYLSSDGRCILSYWALGKNGSRGGIRLAKAEGPDYLSFKKEESLIVEETELGVTLPTVSGKITEYVSCADPSNIFFSGGNYHMLLGNLCALNKNRENAQAPLKDKTGWLDVISSQDLKKWEWEHRFFPADDQWVVEGEDNMCPAFFPLPKKDGSNSGKYVLLFISHNRGAQYYIGELKEEETTFSIAYHDRFSRNDNTVFAPEAFLAPDGRLISVFWYRENYYFDDLQKERAFGWSGVYSLFQSLSLEEDGGLFCSPIQEYDKLCHQHSSCLLTPKEVFSWAPSRQSFRIKISGEIPASFELLLHFRNGGTVTISFSSPNSEAFIDTTDSKAFGRLGKELALIRYKKRWNADVFIDVSTVELFINGTYLSRRLFVEEGIERISISCKSDYLTITTFLVDSISIQEKTND